MKPDQVILNDVVLADEQIAVLTAALRDGEARLAEMAGGTFYPKPMRQTFDEALTEVRVVLGIMGCEPVEYERPLTLAELKAEFGDLVTKPGLRP